MDNKIGNKIENKIENKFVGNVYKVTTKKNGSVLFIGVEGSFLSGMTTFLTGVTYHSNSNKISSWEVSEDTFIHLDGEYVGKMEDLPEYFM